MSNPISALTMGELAQLEAYTGQSLTSFEDPNAPKAAMMIGLAWLIYRRQDPAFTTNQAEALTLDQVNTVLGLNAESAPSGE